MNTAKAPHRREETLGESFTRLGATTRGLTGEEAARRLREHGKNAFVTTTALARALAIVRSAANPLVVILLVAGGASALVGEVLEASIIAAIVILSGLVNALQTMRSNRAVRELTKSVAPTATALRDGQFVELPRADVVPGDVVRLSAGDLVPADARLIEAADLHVHEAALTGESLPVEKRPDPEARGASGPERTDLVFLGTSIVSGTATALVLATGARTAYGDVVERLAEQPEETEFERGTRRFGFLIVQTVSFLVFFILVANLAAGRPALQALLFSVALAVGLTPEFLPMITTVTLASGARRMAREQVIVKHLSAIQNLGSIDVLCSDKTGTLTTGAMTVDASLDVTGAPSDDALALARQNSRFETGIKSPLDAAILEDAPPADADIEKRDEVPFDFERRRVSVVVEEPGGTHRMITKGAPESVFAVCDHVVLDGALRAFDDHARQIATATFTRLSEDGFRLLAVASRVADPKVRYDVDDERALTLTGFLAFADHELPGVAECIARLRDDGVAVKILTGDNELVTRHLSARAGIDTSEIVLGRDVDRMDDGALAHVAERVSVFARLSPAQKHRVIRALRSRKHVVGFLGDGINDAPSLHGADVGISAAGAVDVAKEAADIILLARRLDVLHAGIIAGRTSFGNVLKYLLMGTSSNFGNMLSMAAAALVLPFLPMLPTQILLANFLYDLAQVTIPTDRVDAALVARPQRWDVSVIRRFMLLVGPVSSAYDLLTFYVLYKVFAMNEATFHTGWFVESLATQTLVLFVIRTAGRPWRARPSLPLAATTLAIVAFGLALPMTPIAGPLGMVPLPARAYAFVGVVVVTYLGVVELIKGRVMRRIVTAAPTLTRRGR